MVKLHQLISKWLAEHPILKDHFVTEMVDPRPANFEVDLWFEAIITYNCANLVRPNDGLALIYENQIEIMGNRTPATNPKLFKRLERELRRMHDRTGEFNIVTFRHACKKWLRDCACKKAFCGC